MENRIIEMQEICVEKHEEGRELLIVNERHQENVRLVERVGEQIIPQTIWQKIFCCACDEESNTVNEYNAFVNCGNLALVVYDENNEEHENQLKEFYDEGQKYFTQEQRENDIPWKVLGFQTQLPRRELIEGGLHVLLFMSYFIENYSHEVRELFNTTKLSFVSVSTSISVKLRSFLLMKGTGTMPITRKQMKAFVYNLVRNPMVKATKSKEEMLFKMEAEILFYCLQRFKKRNLRRMNEMNDETMMPAEIIDDAILICGNALNYRIDTGISLVEQLKTLLMNDLQILLQ